MGYNPVSTVPDLDTHCTPIIVITPLLRPQSKNIFVVTKTKFMLVGMDRRQVVNIFFIIQH
jgi:hypothetical protein